MTMRECRAEALDLLVEKVRRQVGEEDARQCAQDAQKAGQPRPPSHCATQGNPRAAGGPHG
jgi:hypothetical protein